jgi:hypothetical protein
MKTVLHVVDDSAREVAPLGPHQSATGKRT